MPCSCSWVRTRDCDIALVLAVGSVPFHYCCASHVLTRYTWEFDGDASELVTDKLGNSNTLHTMAHRPRRVPVPSMQYSAVPQSPGSRSTRTPVRPPPKSSSHMNQMQSGRGAITQGVATGAIGAAYGPYSVRSCLFFYLFFILEHIFPVSATLNSRPRHFQPFTFEWSPLGCVPKHRERSPPRSKYFFSPTNPVGYTRYGP